MADYPDPNPAASAASAHPGLIQVVPYGVRGNKLVTKFLFGPANLKWHIQQLVHTI